MSDSCTPTVRAQQALRAVLDRQTLPMAATGAYTLGYEQGYCDGIDDATRPSDHPPDALAPLRQAIEKLRLLVPVARHHHPDFGSVLGVAVDEAFRALASATGEHV